MIGSMRFRPQSRATLIADVADQVARRPAQTWTRLLVDGAPPTDPGGLAEELAQALRVRGRATLTVSAGDFLRPASLRFERGRTDPDARYTDWVDFGALRREVLEPLAPGGTGTVLPSLWDAAADRASRADYVPLPPGGVLLLTGDMLVGRGLPVDYTLHLWLSRAALVRRTPDELAWTIDAFVRYHTEASPLLVADTAVRVDDPAHPAVYEHDS
jgi:hypothetical protein